MPQRLVVVALLIGLVAPDPLLACGDKFLSVARGTRFQRAPSGNQETVLVYAAPSTEVPAALSRVPVESVLSAAGYRPRIVADRAQLEAELNGSRWDLLLIDLADVDSVLPALSDTTNVLPIVIGATKQQLKAARARFSVVLSKAPTSDALARAVSLALASRSSAKSD